MTLPDDEPTRLPDDFLRKPEPQQPPEYGQAPYPPPPPSPYPPGYGQPFAPRLPDHPQALTAMIVGLISLIGGLAMSFFCCGLGLPFLGGPFAWYVGAKAKREIEAAPETYGGQGYAVTGMVTGIIATVLLILCILAVVLVVALVVFGIMAAPDYSENTY